MGITHVINNNYQITFIAGMAGMIDFNEFANDKRGKKSVVNNEVGRNIPIRIALSLITYSLVENGEV